MKFTNKEKNFQSIIAYIKMRAQILDLFRLDYNFAIVLQVKVKGNG